MRRLAAASFMVLASCGSGFERPSEVNGPRLLAIVVEPPSAAPGVDLEVRAFTARPNDEPLALRWRLDLGVAALARSAGQTFAPSEADLVLEGNGETFTVSGVDTSRAIDVLLETLGEAPIGTPEGVVRTVYEQVGLEASLELTVSDAATGEVLVDGFKRVIITPTGQSANPPAPRFRLGERWLNARDRDDGRCVPEDGGDPPTVAPTEEVTLTPDEDEPWLESYDALDLNGARITAMESAYYAWFATLGSFSSDMTRAPRREVHWTAPDAEGVVDAWLVVRDGHLGTSTCRFALDVR